MLTFMNSKLTKMTDKNKTNQNVNPMKHLLHTYTGKEYSRRNQRPVVKCCFPLQHLTKSALFAKSSILTHFCVILRDFWVKLHKKCPFMKIPNAALKF